jgi:hypothetical protein
MSDDGERGRGSARFCDDSGAAVKGPNLYLLYGLIALALVTAICCALMIVLPFYHRRFHI